MTELKDYDIDKIADEFSRLKEKCYLDHAGTTLYSERQIESVYQNLRDNVYTSPHTSKATEDIIDQVRYRILKHFNTDNNHYDVVFTSGATVSLKTVAECFDFGEAGIYSYLQENHTSVLGMRELVKTDRVHVLTRKQILENVQKLDERNLTEFEPSASNSLVSFPAQCNFSGFKYPLSLIKSIQQHGLQTIGEPLNNSNKSLEEKSKQSWFVCLDAAAYASTNNLDLADLQPDFISISFYKIFGYPTGLGALLVSKRGQSALKKSYFGGGTVQISMSKVDFHVKRENVHERFEDGTQPYLSIIALLAGFNTIERLIGSESTMTRISHHVFHLTKYCYKQLRNLTYANNRQLVKIYAHTEYDSMEEQGGVITFNLLHHDGSYIGYAEVACMANIYNIVLRTGCFCNPGACQVLLELSDSELRKHFQAGHICGDYNDLVNGLPTGAVRISFGYMSRKQDVDRLIYMLQDVYLKGINERSKKLADINLPANLLHIKERLKNSERKIRLKQICIYPIKSCGAYKINDTWELTDKGFKYDRCWMIVNSNGVSVTQKTTSKLCLIRPEINLKREKMVLSFPGDDSIEVSLHPINKQIVTSSLCQSKVCGDFIEGIDCGDEVARWISRCMETEGLRLIQQYDGTQRLNRNGNAKDITLANQAQFLLINYTSVAWLASKVEEWHNVDGNDIDGIVDRFRGNLIIETPEPLQENSFEAFNIGGIDFRIDGTCTRCQMICIDPKTGDKTAEPLRTIAKLFEGKMRFGIYLSQSKEDFRKEPLISCSDVIKVI